MHEKHCAPTQTFASAKYFHDAISFRPCGVSMPRSLLIKKGKH